MERRHPCNKQEQAGGGYGHHIRFFPARDRSGNVIADTYLMGLDYQGINYDYQDVVYLISNVKPARVAEPDAFAFPSPSPSPSPTPPTSTRDVPPRRPSVHARRHLREPELRLRPPAST